MSPARLGILVAATGLMPLTSVSAQTLRTHNPPTIHAPQGYSQVVEVPPGSRMLFLSGQAALDIDGDLVGRGDFAAQAVQVFENIRLALAAVGADFSHVVKLNFYILDVAHLPTLREVRDRYVDLAAPPASTLVEVRRLFREDVMLEIEAVAVLPPR